MKSSPNTDLYQNALPLAGIRVLDCTWYYVGPYATMLLAMLGAEVIKVESLTRVDGTRLFGVLKDSIQGGSMDSSLDGITDEQLETSVSWHDMNLNKLSIHLNMRNPLSRDLVRQLVNISDVIIENMSSRGATRLGLTFEKLREYKPDLIMVSAGAHGRTGPEKDYVGMATTFNAVSGLAHLTGYPDLPPGDIRDGSDLRSGASVAFATLAAIDYRERTGLGQYVDVASTETLTCLLGETLLGVQMTGRVPTRMGNRADQMAPHNCYPCLGEDKWIAISVATDQEWRNFCISLKKQEWLNDQRFQDSFSRYRHQDELDILISEHTKHFTPYYLMHLLQSAGVASTPSMSSRDLSQDPHLRQWGLFHQITHPLMGQREVMGAPWKFEEVDLPIQRAPLMGEQDKYVYNDLLGLTQDQVNEYIQGNVIV